MGADLIPSIKLKAMTGEMINIQEGDAQDSALSKRSAGKLLRRMLTVVGVGFFIFLIFYVGWQNIVNNIVRFGFWFVVILLLQMIWVIPPAFSWNIIQNNLCKRAPLSFFLRIKIISDSMNTIIPTANLGGDALRIYLIKNRIPLKEGIAGILLDKTVESIAGTLFMIFGFLINILFFSIPRELIMPVMICLLVMILALTLFIFFQIRGFYRSALRFFGWIPAVRRLLLKNEETLRIIDENIRRLYTHGRVNIPLTVCLHFMGRITGIFEVMIIMWVLHQPVSFLGAWFISAAVTIGNTILFIVPGHWGVQEGLYVLVLKIMSFSPSVGLSLGIIRRIRRIFLLGLGLLLFNLEKEIQKKGPIHQKAVGQSVISLD